MQTSRFAAATPRVQLVDELEASGIPPERVAAAIADDALSLSYLDPFPTRRRAPTGHTLRSATSSESHSRSSSGSMWDPSCPQSAESVRHEDLDVISGLPILFASELGEGEVLRASKVCETALEAAGLHRKPSIHPEACAFADLSGYTRVTEELRDREASRMAVELADLMEEIGNEHRGVAVKMLGDGVHFHFPDPADAVLGSLEFVEKTPTRGLPPAHVGVNAGPMTYTDGDYYGLTVIIVARIASHAPPGQVLVGEGAIARDVLNGVRFESIGPVSLKGVARPVPVFEPFGSAADLDSTTSSDLTRRHAWA
jgi:class 3 adenylate cyclase